MKATTSKGPILDQYDACFLIAAAVSFPWSVAVASSCAVSNEDISYFRRLADVNSWVEPIVGISPVSMETAKKIAHFRIQSNDCGQPRHIQYFHGDTPKPIDENFATNRLTPASEIIIDRRSNQSTFNFFDHLGRPKPVFGGVSSVKVDQDDQHRPIAVRLEDDNGNLIDSSLGYAQVRWRWERGDRARETRMNRAGKAVRGGSEFPFSHAEIKLGESGQIKSIFVADDKYTVYFTRRKDGVRQSWNIERDGAPFRAGSAQVSRIEYAYDENRYLVQARYLDQAGAPLIAPSGHMGFQRTYTDAGNRLGYVFINDAGERWAPPARGYAGQRFFWREDGVVRLRTEYFDENGALIDHPTLGYATIIHEFDSENDEINRTFKDMNDRPVTVE